MTYSCAVTEDKDSVVLEMRENEKPLAHMIFDSSEAEQLIHNLALCRSQMADQVTPALDPNARLAVDKFPGWRIPHQHNGPEGTVLMALRHQGMGWIGFLLEKDRAKMIGETLVAASVGQSKSA